MQRKFKNKSNTSRRDNANHKKTRRFYRGSAAPTSSLTSTSRISVRAPLASSLCLPVPGREQRLLQVFKLANNPRRAWHHLSQTERITSGFHRNPCFFVLGFHQDPCSLWQQWWL